MSNEEKLADYFNFLRNLPILPFLEREKIVKLVKEDLQIDVILKSPIIPENIIGIENGSNLIERLSTKHGQSLRVLAPPVNNCLLCNEALTMSNKPAQIALHTQTGPKVYSKYILRCQNCRLVDKSRFDESDESNRQTIYYHPDKYGNMKNGYMFYKQEIGYVKASNEVYIEKALIETCMSNFMHGFMSMETTAEAYNESFRSSVSVQLFKEFLIKNQAVGNHFNKQMKELDSNEDLNIPATNYFNQKDIEAAGKQVQNTMYELHRKSVVNAYYNYLVKQELNERKQNYIFWPYRTEEGQTFSFHDSVERFLEEIDELRSKESYAHNNCAG